jgi:hypothetical protein
MREGLFILAVLAVILILTAIRYRKQITGAIGLARAIKEARRPRGMAGERKAGALVPCSKCGVRIPEDKAISIGGGKYRCGRECTKVTA